VTPDLGSVANLIAAGAATLALGWLVVTLATG
jgi:hypothetical protein